MSFPPTDAGSSLRPIAILAARTVPHLSRQRHRWIVPLLLALSLSLPMTAQADQDDHLIAELQALRGSGDTSAAAVQRLRAIEAQTAGDASYPLRREILRADLVVLDESRGYEDTLAAMQSLRELADVNGDADTVNLMDINRIFMSHVDDDINRYIDQLNEVRARLSSESSPDVMEALERSYGNMYFDAGNFDSALRHQLAALEWAEKLPVGSVRARLFRLGTIAELYNAMQLPDSALDYVDRAFALGGDELPLQNRISLLMARAMALMQGNQLPEADLALSRAETLSLDDPSVFTAMRLGTARIKLLLAMSSPDDAIVAINRLEEQAKAQENSYYLAKSWVLRGEALMQLDRVEEGRALMQRALDFFESKGQMIDVLDGLERQVDTLRAEGLPVQALEAMERQQTLWVHLFRNERARTLAELEAHQSARELENRVSALSAENRAQQASLRAERLSKALALVLALLAALASAFLVFAIRRARRERDKLSDAARLDTLTGAFSRYQFQQRAVREARRTDASTGVLLLDIDHFKAINDRHGHEAGDAVLKTLVTRVRGVVAADAEIYRWGGEEFLVVMNPQTTQTVERDVVRLVAGIEDEPLRWHDTDIRLRVSGGFVRCPLADGWPASLDDAIRWADAALYLAKNEGRQRIEQIELTAAGIDSLRGQTPVDFVQLQDWKRRDLLQTRALGRGALVNAADDHHD
ncbi:MAG: diguanylate cyclase [Xanthomonadales bacterium]|nr:diguanylate cyclase [Xanthomonadales bacterium]